MAKLLLVVVLLVLNLFLLTLVAVDLPSALHRHLIQKLRSTATAMRALPIEVVVE